MAIKSIKVDKSEEVNFPKLMVSPNELIVLMISSRHGTVMNEVDSRRIGEFSDEWNMDRFKDYNGEVKLKNK